MFLISALCYYWVMNLFCANAFTGEDFDTVSKRMQFVVDTLNAAGHNAYCPVFDPYKIELQEKQATKEIFDYAFQNITKSDGMVAIITSGRKSEGMLMEFGAALAAHKPLYLFIHESAAGVSSHVPKLATKVFTWSTEQSLGNQLKTI